MSEHVVFLIVLGACVCGALIDVGVLEYAVWLLEHEEGRRG